MKYFRQLGEFDEVKEGDLVFYEDDPIVESHRVKIEKYALTKSPEEIQQLLDECP